MIWLQIGLAVVTIIWLWFVIKMAFESGRRK